MREPTTVSEALEALSALAELDSEGEGLGLMLLEPGQIPAGEARIWSVLWLQEHGADQTVLLVRRLFGVVLAHLREIATTGLPAAQRQRALRGMVSILATVGETAPKLDHLTRIFYGAQRNLITQTAEYRELQQFYEAALSEEEPPISIEAEPFAEAVEIPDPERLTELQRVILDLDYELYLLRDDEGDPFLTSSLRESTELACDFGIDFDAFVGDDPLVWVVSWRDELLQYKASFMLEQVWPAVEEFYAARREGEPSALTDLLNSAMIALMLASKPYNRLSEFAKKPSYRYFRDFQFFLRELLTCRGYEHLLTYPPAGKKRLAQAQRRLAHALAGALYTADWEAPTACRAIEELVQREELPLPANPEAPLAELLRANYEALRIGLERHPSGPLFKMLDLVREEELPPLDLMLEGNIPGRLWEIPFDGVAMSLLRLPAPTRQITLSQPELVDEFRGYLRCGTLSYKQHGHLLINLMSRTDWREQSRAQLLEGLQKYSDLGHQLAVVTLASSGEFYEQQDGTMPIAEFCAAFESEMCDSERSYGFPDFIRQALFPSFIQGAMGAISHLFFAGKAELTWGDRQVFIDLTHLLITFKLLDLYQPDDFAFICKDGVDESMAASAILFLAWHLFRSEEVDTQQLQQILYAPAILFRERAIQPHVHERMVRVLQAIEQGLGDDRLHRLSEELAPLYHTQWWHA
jgi:hypothetical protein